jgi:hypothetical protein
MNKIELVKSAWDRSNPDAYAHHADDFQYTDELGSPPMSLESWLVFDRLMRSAFPDLSTPIDEIREENGDVVLTSQGSGTFANDLDLSAMGLGVIPATGECVTFPVGTVRVSFEGDEISRIHSLDTGPDAGLPGLLKALGMESN